MRRCTKLLSNKWKLGGIVWQRVVAGLPVRCLVVEQSLKKTGERKRCIHARKQLRYISIVNRIQLKTGDVFRFVQGLERRRRMRRRRRKRWERRKFEVARTRSEKRVGSSEE